MSQQSREISKDDIDLFKRFQKSPLLFIENVWKLVPQPIKKVYLEKCESLLDVGNYDEIRPYFFEEFQKGKHITWQQFLFFHAIERGLAGKGKLRISIVSGHGTGKSRSLAMLILWFLFCFAESQIPCTAPTSQQMFDVLWKELKKCINDMPEDIKILYDWTSTYIRMVESPETWFARAATGRKENPEALAGVHGDFVMFVIDEAAGVVEEVFTTSEGALTGDNVIVVMISNGTRAEGYFYDSHHDDSEAWVNLSFDSEDSPIVKPEYVQRIIEKFGIESDEFRYMVKGSFPKTEAMDDKGFVPLIIKEKISLVNHKIEFVGKKRMGIDPAGEGDNKTVWVVRDAFHSKVVAKEDMSVPKSIAAKTLTLMELFGFKWADAEEEITLDNFGVGANVGMEIAVATNGKCKINPVNTGDDADDKDVYTNKRSECYFRAATWFVNGGTTDNDAIVNQFSKTKYRRNLRGKKELIDKKIIKKELKSSPDEADALSLTFYKKEVVEEEKKPYKQPEHIPRNEYEGR